MGSFMGPRAAGTAATGVAFDRAARRQPSRRSPPLRADIDTTPAMPHPPRPGRHVFPSLPRRPIRLVLDGVTHLPNIGTLFRLCDAFRVERLYVCGVELELHKRRLTRAAAGTLGWVPWEPRANAT